MARGFDEFLVEKKRIAKMPVWTNILKHEAKIQDSFRAKFFTGLDKYDRDTIWMYLGKNYFITFISDSE